MCPGWTVAKPDWIRSRRQPWGCVPGMPPTSHDDLPREDEVTRFLRRVAELAMNDLSDDALRLISTPGPRSPLATDTGAITCGTRVIPGASGTFPIG